MARRIRRPVVTAVVAAAVIGVGVSSIGTAHGASPPPTFGVTVTRALYVTDLTQTTAEINWATSGQSTGSVQWAQETSPGTCPLAAGSWSSTTTDSATATTGIPYGAGSGTTGWLFTVGATPEYQNSVKIGASPAPPLTPGTTYCYAVFGGNGPSAPDLFTAPTVQTLTTLSAPDPSSAAPVSFDVLGDTGENFQWTGTDGNGNTVSTPFSSDPTQPPVNPYQSAVYSEIGQDYTSGQAQFLLGAGDVSYSGGSENTLGDLNQPGTVAQAQGAGASEYSNIFGPSYLPLANGIPTYLADGNHGQNSNVLKAFPAQASADASGGAYDLDAYTNGVDGIGSAANPVQSPDDWYAFSTGNVRIYVLDAAWGDSSVGAGDTGSLCGTNASACKTYQADADEHWQPSSPEYQWLQSDLTNPSFTGMVKMAVFHFPLESDNNTQPSDPYLQQDLEPLLAQHGVDIAFNGHAHTYQRYDPPAGSGQIVSYVTGGGGGVVEPIQGGSTCTSFAGGASVYALGYSPNSTTPGATGTPWSCRVKTTNPLPSPFTSPGDVYGYLRVTVTGATVQVVDVDANGDQLDPMTYQFGQTPPPSTTTTSTTTTSTTTPSATTTSTTAPPLATSTPAPVSTTPTAGPTSTNCLAHLPSGSVIGTAALPDGSGYYEVDSAGDVSAFGGAACYGAMTGTPLNRPIVGMAVDPATGGYWLVATDGGIFAFHAPFLGSTGNLHLNQPVVGMTATQDGGGYWFVASDGGIFSFGDAKFYGSTGNLHLNRPVVGMASTPDGHGYRLVASDGGIFCFGDATFLGSTGGIHLNQPIVGMSSTSGGGGYRLIARDGGVFGFGNATFYGSAGSIRLNRPIIGGTDDDGTGGYWLMASDGGVFTFNAPFYGSAA